MSMTQQCHYGLTHSYGQANKAADALASIGTQRELDFVIYKNFPASLVSILELDSMPLWAGMKELQRMDDLVKV